MPSRSGTIGIRRSTETSFGFENDRMDGIDTVDAVRYLRKYLGENVNRLASIYVLVVCPVSAGETLSREFDVPNVFDLNKNTAQMFDATKLELGSHVTYKVT